MSETGAAKEIFFRALDLPESEREAFVTEACGADGPLLDRVRGLLAGHARADDVLGEDRDTTEAVFTGPRELGVGDAVGPYVLEDRLGEGGFGVVFRARQEAPVRRIVAFKVVRVGMDSRQVIARFESERQALAIMDHPNIARVFDAGATPAGRPYFVMEHVDGVPVTDYCRDNGLDTRSRLELFREICLALRHAHQKGVIHRDIKPSNVLVGTVDGRPVPKVIDFGIAKAVERDPSDGETLVTREGHVIGTPSYMSPEQARGQADIDTRSDVYSLGVLLYELLCGEPPFDTGEMRSLALFEMQRRILEEDPAPPSERRRRLRASRTATATTIPIPPELDWIVMRCLEKERGRRYATANDLAQDVGRFLDDRPIEAAPPTPWYRARKFVRRHRTATVAMVMTVLALALGVAGASVGLLSARRERANVLRLSMFSRLEDLRAEADLLWPAELEREREYVAWLARARELVASLDPDSVTGAPGLRALHAELAERASPETPEEVEATLRKHPRYEEWKLRASRLAVEQRARDVRMGLAEPPEIVLPADAPETAAALNELAWSLVDPSRDVYGREAEGIALALRAVEQSDPAEVAQPLDTLAWAYFSVGMDAEAVEASERALDAAPEGQEQSFRGYLRDLEHDIDDALDETATEFLAALAAEVEGLEREIRLARRFPFESEEDRWWHSQLTKLIFEIEAFGDPETGLVDGLSPTHGWGVARRLEFARTVRERTVDGAEAAAAWEDAITWIADEDESPAYGGLELAPQVGLLPLGQDAKSGLWEFAHVASGSVPERGEDGRLLVTTETGLVFVLLPRGTYPMGAQARDPDGANYDPQAQIDEGPVREVTVGPLFLSKYEMTQGQWRRIAGRNPSRYDASSGFLDIDDRHPVEMIGWHAAREWMERSGLRLPTEAEWEFGARAGTTTAWWTGPERESLIGAANLADQAAWRAGGRYGAIAEWPELDDGFGAHAPVGSLAPNAFGLHDVHGNVWEWTGDGYYSDFYSRSTETVDPRCEPTSSRSRVNRGGGFTSGARSCRSANRDPGPPDLVNGVLGVRPARGIDP